MEFVTLNCPSCGGLLPRQARWRMVSCPYCGSVVTLSDSVVQAVDFHKAWIRAQAASIFMCHSIVVSGVRYRIIDSIGGGDYSVVYLAERMSILPERVTIKLARDTVASVALQSEFDSLSALHALKSSGSAYFTQRLPQPVSIGVAEDSGMVALVLRQPVGFWGSLGDVMRYHAAGVSPRHAVWMWRRILEVLTYVHQNGWTHGSLSPEHLLVHPDDHGIMIIGWHKASNSGDTALIARDLMQSAWSIRAVLCGVTSEKPGCGAKTPHNIVEILKRASEDAAWCSSMGAAEIDNALKAAAFEAFGPPAFVQFSPISPL